MTEFTEKSGAIEDVIHMITGGKRRTAGECVFDEQVWNEVHELNFRDELSQREYEISGMCQTCQNGVFG